MAFCISCGAQLPEGAGFCNHCGTAQNAGGQQAPQMQPQFQGAPQMQVQAQAQPPQRGRTGLIIGLVLGGTALVAGLVVLILFLTGVFGGREYSVFLGGTEYGTYKAGSEVTVQHAVPNGADMSFSSEDVTLSRDEKNGMYLISFVMPEKDVTIHVYKTAVVYPVPEPTPQPGPDPVDPKPVDPTALSGEMIRWGVTYFGLELPAEWDDSMVTDFSKSIHQVPNYMEQVLNIEDVNWITLSPCTDQEIITRLETGFELVGILTLPSGYPLYLTMEIDADPSTETGAWILEHREELIDSINASEGALLEKDVVYTGGPMIDMTGLKGVWSSEGGGMRTLTILPDATFRLHSYDFQGGEGKEAIGYLVFDNGVCQVYDESGYPWGGMTGDTYLERNEDGTITWHEGNGAERFVQESSDVSMGDYGEFPGQYQAEPGITCNIWVQMTGCMVGPTFGTDAAPYGEAEYRDGKLFFDITDYDTELTCQGEVEKTDDGIRLTITASDDPEVPAGSVFEMPAVE